MKNRGNFEDVKDVFQDAVTILFQKIKLERFEPQGDINNYLYSMCKNLWINKAKRNKVQYTDEAPDVMDNIESHHTFLINSERKDLVAKLIHDVGEPCGTLMKLMYYKEYSMKELVDTMGFSSVGVAKTNSFRCKKKMMKLIESNSNYKQLVSELL